jgi:hypothetical protein
MEIIPVPVQVFTGPPLTQQHLKRADEDVSTNTTEKPFPCTKCSNAYSHKRGLLDHITRAHTDKRDPIVLAKAQARKDARVKNSAIKRKDPTYVQARKDSLRKARLLKKWKKKTQQGIGVSVTLSK